jgi:hypothetical protein
MGISRAPRGADWAGDAMTEFPTTVMGYTIPELAQLISEAITYRHDPSTPMIPASVAEETLRQQRELRAEVSSLESQLKQAREETEKVYDDYKNAASHLILTESRLQAVTEAHRWIPVEEKLPQRFGNVFVAHTETSSNTPAVEEAQLIADDPKWCLVRTGPCDDAIYLDQQVTHWQPLPMPPIGQADAHEGRDPQQASPEVTGA